MDIISEFRIQIATPKYKYLVLTIGLSVLLDIFENCHYEHKFITALEEFTQLCAFNNETEVSK